MSDGPQNSPPLLAPPPKRGPGVRRLNRKPVLMATGAVLMVIGAIGWTYRDRALLAVTRTQQSETHKPEAGGADDVIGGFDRSVVKQASSRPLAKLPNTAPEHAPPVATAQPSDASNSAQQQGEDLATKARRAAWEAYYQQLAQVRQAKLDALLDAAKANPFNRQGLGAGGTQEAASPLGAAGLPPGIGVAPGGLYGVPGASSYPPAVPDLNAQRQKQAFMAKTGDDQDELQSTIKEPVPFTVMAGTVIPATMQGGINSDLPGQVIGRVSQTVCDSATGNYPLIPQGSTLLGEYDNAVSAGQTRVAVIWHRIIFPDTSSINIGTMPGADQGGYTGFHDRVNRHLVEKIGTALLLSVASAGVQLSQPQAVNGQNYNPQQIGAAALGQQFAQLGNEYARAGLAIPNSLEVRPGFQFIVMANKDVPLRPYVDRRGYRVEGCGMVSQAATPVSLWPAR